jgi:hypothetical protein
MYSVSVSGPDNQDMSKFIFCHRFFLFFPFLSEMKAKTVDIDKDL